MYVRFLREDFDDVSGILTMVVEVLPVDYDVEVGDEFGETSEDIGDTDVPEGIINYVTSRHLHQRLRKVRVVTGGLLDRLRTSGRDVSSADTLMEIPLSLGNLASYWNDPSTPAAVTTKRDVYLRNQPCVWGYGRIEQISAGTRLHVNSASGTSWLHVTTPDGRDGYIVSHPYYCELDKPATAPNTDETQKPLMYPDASRQAKFEAVYAAAEGRLGAPYVWGHSQAHGHHGFDNATFTAFVYHTALGIRLPTMSRTQAARVGLTVPVTDMLPGDLLIFNRGRHVGIYAGHGRMIEQGGGLGKVGFLRVSPGSYWYSHLTAVKRVF